MSLFVFSTVVLSIIFMLVFNTWWVGSAPFKMHLSALIIATITVLSIILMIAIYPILTRRASYSQKPASLDKTSWANEVSGNLSTPAAVVDGYNVVFANKAFLTELGMLGMNEQILGMPITNIIHPGDHQHLAMMFAQTSQDENNRDTMKLRLLCLDGSILPAHISLSPLQEDGHSELNLLQFSSVASHRMKEDDSVEQSNCQQLINQIEQVVFHLNVNQEFMFLNTSWETLLDYKIQESLNKPLLSFIHPEDKPLVEARINSLIQGKRRQSLVDLRLIGRNGDSHWVELRARNTSNYKGERSSVIGTLTDISHMKITEAGLRNNINVGIGYMEAWIRGVGCVPLHNLMEDAATAEISRTQVWQWLKYGAKLADGRAVTRELVLKTVDEELAVYKKQLGDEKFYAGRFVEAAGIVARMSTAPKCEEFLTLPGYRYLD